MAGAYVGQVGTNTLSGTGSTITVTVGTLIPIGSFLIVAVSDGDSTTVTVTDNRGNTYNADLTEVSTSRKVYILSCLTTVALRVNDIITVTYSNVTSSARRVVVDQFTGFTGTNLLDQTNSATGNTTTPNSGNVTTTQAKELLYNNNVFGTAGATMTPETTGVYTYNKTAEFQQSGSGTFLETQYVFVENKGTFSGGGTITSAVWGSGVATYKISNVPIKTNRIRPHLFSPGSAHFGLKGW